MTSPNGVELAARSAHEINRAYCLAMGDATQVSWEQAPAWQKESCVKGVEALLKDPLLTPEQMHGQWVEHKASLGWTYGLVKDVDQLTHPCMVPYSELPKEQRIKDYLFRAAVFSTLSTLLDAGHA